jgi:hypothetical protein
MSSTKQNTGFGLGNLPYGIFSTTDDPRCRIGIAVESYVLDLSIFLQQQPIQDLDFDPLVLRDETLNRYAALGRPVHQHVRAHLQHTLPRLLKQDGTELRAAGLRHGGSSCYGAPADPYAVSVAKSSVQASRWEPTSPRCP